MKTLIMRRVPRLLILVFLSSLFSFAANQAVAQTASEPVLLTSCGQSPGPVRLKIFLQKLNVNFDYNLQAKADDLISKKKEGKPYKSIIIVTGASLKGMGAAGVSMDDELSRTKALIAEAKKQGIKIIGSHIEGMARRSQGATAGDNTDEMSIDAVCNVCDFMIVKKEGDSDGRFTTISKGKNIPLILFELNTEISDVLKKVYNK
ncbi:MAG: hypothetical protein D4R64_18835 [Porphyromonadaceae bacterium]|nr:MAG: hypothetical protein D4R64_18835 [Porphyromonadaceae bacterium]